MSILLIGDPGSLGEILVRRLIAQGDEVRAIATDSSGEAVVREGVHIARGPDLDADLVERAAQNVRTIVTFDPSDEVVGPVLEGAVAARVERIVVCASEMTATARERLRDSGLEYVVLQAPRRGVLRRRVPDGALAEAIDAADDISGQVRLDLDLTDPAAWQELKLKPPSS